MDQRSKEWHEARSGMFTASECFKLMGKKFGPLLTDFTEIAQTYILEKVSDNFTNNKHEVNSKEMAWGIEHEPIAKGQYELTFACEILDEGFVYWIENNQCGCSPDGIIKGEKRGIEIKCPYNPANHLKNLLIKSNSDFKNEFPQYYWQVQMSLMIYDFEKWDYVSFHPFFNTKTRLNCIEILRDDKDITYLKERLNLAVEIKNKIIKEISL